MQTIKGNTKALFTLSQEQLEAICLITNAEIKTETYPLVGKIYYLPDGGRAVEHEPTHKHLEFAYEWDSEGHLLRIYVGSKYHGPILSWYDGQWTNLYSHGNFGHNYACGGNWSADSKKRYATLAECLDNRDYMVGNIPQERATLTEGAGIIAVLRGL
jgi:hypothetical protein